MATIIKCKHLGAVPIEFAFGKRKRIDGTNDWVTDYSSVIANATKARVIKYYCFACGEEIDIPLEVNKDEI
mgnify:CR=1 FL=1